MQSADSPQTPRAAGFSQPAEWQRHDACWLAWPSHGELWKEALPRAQEEFTALCEAVSEAGERLRVLVPSDTARTQAERALAGLQVEFHPIPFGDIWLRDTAPIFLGDKNGARATVRFGFNGWGGKYRLPHDPDVSARIAAAVVPEGIRAFRLGPVLEGGALEVDGEGTCLTTEQCLLNPNRNPGMDRTATEAFLREALGVERILWLREGLLNDHTDGHVDTLARFCRPGKVVCMEARDDGEPNQRVLAQIARELSGFSDARGRRLEVIRVPSPGLVTDEDGKAMPASYLNFYVGNRAVIVPTYGSRRDAEAVAALGACFPGRRAIGLSARAILAGGGAFHCITQQQPAEGGPHGA